MPWLLIASGVADVNPAKHAESIATAALLLDFNFMVQYSSLIYVAELQACILLKIYFGDGIVNMPSFCVGVIFT